MTKTTATSDIPVKTMRIPQQMWDEFGESSKQLGSNRTELVLLYMEWVNKTANPRLRRRPGGPPAASSA